MLAVTKNNRPQLFHENLVERTGTESFQDTVFSGIVQNIMVIFVQHGPSGYQKASTQ